MRVGGVGLAALPGGEHPRMGGQLRRHIDDLLTVGQQPAGDMPANALASLDRPSPVRPSPRGGEHRPVPGGIGAILAAGQHCFVPGHDLDRRRALMRIHADDHLAHASPPAGVTSLVRRGGHRYFEQGEPSCDENAAVLIRDGGDPRGTRKPLLVQRCGTRPAQAK
jgi:hypothetical protein